MANFRRKKTKRRVHCQICTPYRWRGNNQGRFKAREEDARKRARAEAGAV